MVCHANACNTLSAAQALARRQALKAVVSVLQTKVYCPAAAADAIAAAAAVPVVATIAAVFRPADVLPGEPAGAP